MDISKIVVSTKASRWLLMQHNFALGENQLIDWLQETGQSWVHERESHLRQQHTISKLREHLKDEQFLPREQITKDRLLNASAVIVAGGDNQLQFAAQYISHTPAIPINSDPQSSYGGTIDFLPQDIDRMLHLLESDDFEISPWTRVEVKVAGQPTRYALSELMFSEPRRRFVSRIILEVENGKLQIPIPSSGALVTTGTGLTGHACSSGWYLPQKLRQAALERLSRSSSTGVYMMTEPFLKLPVDSNITEELVEKHHLFGFLEAGQTLKVHSATREGTIAVDSEREIPFRQGKIAHVRMAPDYPLNVIVKPSHPIELS